MLMMLTCLCLSASAQTTTAGAGVAPRIVARVDDTSLVTIHSSTHPAIRTAKDMGRLSPSVVMGDLILVLKRSDEQQAALNKLNADQYNASSPSYHQWLAPAEFGAAYGVAQADVETVSDWLQNHGFTIQEIPPSRTSIRFSGTAGQVEATFHTEMHSVEYQGETHIANMSDIQIPAALTPVVVGVKALHNFFPKAAHHLSSQDRSSLEGSGVMKHPGLLKESLNVPALVVTTPVASIIQAEIANGTAIQTSGSSGVRPAEKSAPKIIDGTGQTIAIAGRSNILLEDIATYRSCSGLPANTPTVIVTNSDPGVTAYPDDRLESSLDIEWAGGIAPGATFVLVTSSTETGSTDGLLLSEMYAVNNNVAPVLNVSYGECELFMGTAGNLLYANLWQQAYTQGIAVFVSTGDGGSATCDGGYSGSESNIADYAAIMGLTVNGFASTPYNVAVGGTDFNWTSDSFSSTKQDYVTEIAWNDTITNPLVVSSFNSQYGVDYDAEGWANRIYGDYLNGSISLSDYLTWIEPIGTGGGVSNCTSSDQSTTSSCTGGYAKPAWQAGVPGILASEKRTIPDVSFFAGNGLFGTAALICDSFSIPCNYTTEANINAQSVGGTSVSAPAMAGVMALINQYAGTPQGNPNPVLYALAAKQSWAACSAEIATNASACYFRGTDTGNSQAPCAAGTPNCTLESSNDALGILSGYTATIGYNKATGLGSLNIANVVLNWPISSLAPQITGLNPSSATPGGAAFTLTINGTNFTTDSTAVWSGTALATTYVSATEISALVPAGLIGAPGTAQVAVTNSVGTASFVTFAIVPPAPTTTSLSPSSIPPGSAAFTLIINGTNFTAGSTAHSTVQWNGNMLATTYVSATELTAAVTPDLIAAAGSAGVTVTTCAGASSPVTFTIKAATPGTPAITSLNPTSAAAGGAAFALTVNGTNFTSSATVQWASTALTTTYVSATQLTAAVPASLIAAAGTVNVTVTTSGGTSSAAAFTINAATPGAPTITGLSPSSATAGGAAFTLTVNGTNFVSGATVQWGSTSLVTTYLSATQLTAAVPASLIATSGSASLTVTTSGGTSSGATFTITQPAPTITSLSPSSATAGGAAFTLTISGTNFTSGATAQWGTTVLVTTYVSAAQLTTTVPASLIATAGTANVTVTTSGGTSSGATFTINPAQTTPVSFTLSGTAVTIVPGASAGNTSTITVAPAGGFTGSVTLTATLASSPSGALDLPTLSFDSTSPVSIVGTTAGTATLAIATTAATTSSLVFPQLPGHTGSGTPWYATGGATLACLLLFGIPARRRNWRSVLGMTVVLLTLVSGIIACGGGSSSNNSNSGNPGTTVGSYTVTVTGTDVATGKITSSTTVNLTVN